MGGYQPRPELTYRKQHDCRYDPSGCRNALVGKLWIHFAPHRRILFTALCRLNVLKFFPASDFGGIKTMKALSAAFPDVRFVPTGGVGESNLHEFLGQKFVLGAGGSWMMKGTESDIETASRRAVEIAKEYTK